MDTVTRVKLTARQAAVLKGASDSTVNGRTRRAVAWIKGTPVTTYARLYRLGLIDAPHHGASLTSMGLTAQMTLATAPYGDTRIFVRSTNNH